MIGKFISGRKLMERWKIEQHELMHLILTGLRPYHPVYGVRYYLYSDLGLHSRHQDLDANTVEEWGELFPLLHDCLFLLSDVEKHDLDISVTAGSTEVSPTQVGRKKTDEIPAENYFYHEGNSWRIGFQGEKATFLDYKYIRYVAILLDKPNKAIKALELVHAVDDKIHQSGLTSKTQAFDEGLSVNRPYRDEEMSDKKLREMIRLKNEIEEENDPIIKKELKKEFDRKIADLRLEKINALVDEEGRPARPPEKQKLDDPLSKKAQKSVRKGLDTAYSTFNKANLKKLAKHLEKNIKTAGYYDFSYRNSDISWDIIS